MFRCSLKPTAIKPKKSEVIFIKNKRECGNTPFQSQSIRFAERITCAALHCRMPELLCKVKSFRWHFTLMVKINYYEKIKQRFIF